MAESYVIKTLIWLRTMHNSKQLTCEEKTKVSLKIQNRSINALNDLMHLLLDQIKAWGTAIKRENDDELRLVKEASSKNTPVELSKYTDNVQTIKEALEFFSLSGKEVAIHIIVERQQLVAPEPKSEPKSETEFSEDSSVKVKKEKRIK
jgi:hypothetical protein